MRRLPIYFLIDVSESMVGEPIEWVQDGMATISGNQAQYGFGEGGFDVNRTRG